MNRLGYISSIGTDKIPVAELTVDDVPLAKLLGCDDLIGYDIYEKSRPQLEPDPNKNYVFAVCSCGVSGCGSIEGSIITGSSGKTVLFKEFKYTSSSPILEFTLENYTSVIEAIEEEFQEHELREFKEQQEQDFLDQAHAEAVIKAYFEALVQLASKEDIVTRTAEAMFSKPQLITAREIARWLVSPMLFEERQELVEEPFREMRETSSDLDFGISFTDGEIIPWSLRVTTDDTARILVIEAYTDSTSAPIETRRVDLSAIL
ncbi:MAG: hypothetical protein KC652_27720 [Cyanobacteria bacterium HKST-UBA01]|nr:hypothetical protein [Cyanobacteria bacterium HKST-UBA01]